MFIVTYLVIYITCKTFCRPGQAVSGRPEESQVSPARRRPLDAACGVQLVAQQQVLECLVLRELRAGPHAEEGTGRAETDARNYGSVSDCSCVSTTFHKTVHILTRFLVLSDSVFDLCFNCFFSFTKY